MAAVTIQRHVARIVEVHDHQKSAGTAGSFVPGVHGPGARIGHAGGNPDSDSPVIPSSLTKPRTTFSNLFSTGIVP